MAFYSAFQWNAFQWNAFQVVSSGGVPETVGGGRTNYSLPYQSLIEERHKREKIKREKTELERLQSVLKETERKKELAAESKILADKAKKLKRVIQLEKLEQEYLLEINRLLMVRAELIRRIRSDEETLVIMIATRKRRLRFSFQPASVFSLHK